MATKFSDVIGVHHEDLSREGALDAFVNIDSRLYVDPHMLQAACTPELSGSYARFISYFEDVIRLLKASQKPYDRMFREAASRLIFKELSNVSLGYSKSGSSGSGIGIGLAKQLATTAKEIIDAGIVDPTIFEIVGLIEKNIGADRISDMTIRIILPDLLAFSQRVASNLNVRTGSYNYDGASYKLPYNPETGKLIVFVPTEILRDLPIAYDWDDIDVVCAHNKMLRRIVNRIIGKTWKQATKNVRKSELKDLFLRYPDLLHDLLSQYSSKHGKPYDFEEDPLGLFDWESAADTFSGAYPLELSLNTNPTVEDVLGVVKTICYHFKQLVENNGLNRLFYDNDGKLKHESYAQLLFFGIADSYCTANDLDISREPNAGRGPVDFKISRGLNAKITVETKYSTNNQLVHGFETQLPIYNQAEKSHYSIYLVIKTSRSENKILEILDLYRADVADGKRAPEIIVIDGQLKSSASKA